MPTFDSTNHNNANLSHRGMVSRGIHDLACIADIAVHCWLSANNIVMHGELFNCAVNVLTPTIATMLQV